MLRHRLRFELLPYQSAQERSSSNLSLGTGSSRLQISCSILSLSCLPACQSCRKHSCSFSKTSVSQGRQSSRRGWQKTCLLLLHSALACPFLKPDPQATLCSCRRTRFQLAILRHISCQG